MPFTPFHFGPHGCVGLPISKKINVLVFVLANVVVDIESNDVSALRMVNCSCRDNLSADAVEGISESQIIKGA